ncbi:cupredoxin domain-containing protein [Demequina sp.]|uniref:cupredoxin domain-containing protein n=1 Tax=Demequina sp. TaxID=2050685 RepID=UPI0025DEA0DB|nr:cupredoxin domain-containing protein [Demequina sp.]
MTRPMPRRRSAVPATLTLVLGVLLLSACAPNAASTDTAVAVRSTADECELSSTEAPSGTVVFDVTNDGTDATEFYVYAADGTTIIAEVENVGPGITRQVVVEAAAGDYVTACKPGMTGDGIRATFTVTD